MGKLVGLSKSKPVGCSQRLLTGVSTGRKPPVFDGLTNYYVPDCGQRTMEETVFNEKMRVSGFNPLLLATDCGFLVSKGLPLNGLIMWLEGWG